MVKTKFKSLAKVVITVFSMSLSFVFGFISNEYYTTVIKSPNGIADPRFIPDPETEGVYMRITKVEYDSLRTIGELEPKENGMNIDRKRGGRK